MKVIRALLALSIVSMAASAASATSTAGQDVAKLISSNLSSHYQAPNRIQASVTFSCDGAQGHYAWEQSLDNAIGYYRVKFVHVEVNGKTLPAPDLAKINDALAGPAIVHSSLATCSGPYVNIQLDVHRMASKPTGRIKTADIPYLVEMKGGTLLKVGKLED